MITTPSLKLNAAANMFAAVTVSIALSSCTHHSASDPSQVAAKVGTYELTIFQVNNAASRLPLAAKDPVAARKVALESLINQELAAQQAERQKLDRSPEVQAAVDQAKLQIVANAYFEQVAHNQPDPSDQEIQQYFDAHPELFARRKSYSLKELTAPFSPEALQFVQTHPDFSLDQAAQWLQSKNIVFNQGMAVRSAESLPINFLPQLVNVKDGATAFTQTGNALYIVQVLGTKSEPVREDQARPAIRKFIQAQRAREAVDKELARLKQTTKIIYEGMYAKSSASESVPQTSVQ